MSIYPAPKLRDGVLNFVFNSADYVRDLGGGGLSLAQTDALYLKNSGVIVSSANTTFNGTVDVEGILNTNRTAKTLSSATTAFTASQSYSFNNGMSYSLASNDTPITSLSILNIPNTPLQTYTFTFTIEPSVKSSPFYLKPTTSKILINETSVSLFGLTSILLPSSYTYLVQEITIMNKSTTTTPSFVAFTNILGYDEKIVRLIAGGNGTNNISYSDDNGITWKLPNNQPFSNSSFGRCGFDGKRIVIGSSNSDIAYSDDFGLTWISTGFSLIGNPFKVIYIPETKKWFVVGIGSNSQNMGTSDDGINWTLLSTTILGSRVYDIIYNGSVYIAVGWSSTYPMATSSDGITWTSNTTFSQDTTNISDKTQKGFSLIYDDSRYIYGGGATLSNTSGNIVLSQDGITWDNTTNINLPFDVRTIVYNRFDTYVAVGSKNVSVGGTNFIYWSNDAITWNPSNNVLMGNLFHADWNGTYFVAGGSPISGSTTNLIYSTDGKNWTASNYDANNGIVGTINGITSIPILPVNIEALLTVDNLNVVSALEAGTITATGLCSANSLKATTSLDTATITATGLCTADSLKVTTSLESGTITAPLATIDTLSVSTLKAKNSSDTLTSDFWRNDQVYSYTNGMVYSLISDDAVVNSVSFINVPTSTNQTYIFTFIMQPSTVNSPYYIKSSTNTINVNGVSIELYGLQNVSLPTNFTFLVQQISIIYDVYYGKQFFALTSVSAY